MIKNQAKETTQILLMFVLKSTDLPVTRSLTSSTFCTAHDFNIWILSNSTFTFCLMISSPSPLLWIKVQQHGFALQCYYYISYLAFWSPHKLPVTTWGEFGSRFVNEHLVWETQLHSIDHFNIRKIILSDFGLKFPLWRAGDFSVQPAETTTRYL